jgi:hypothetical protein
VYGAAILKNSDRRHLPRERVFKRTPRRCGKAGVDPTCRLRRESAGVTQGIHAIALAKYPAQLVGEDFDLYNRWLERHDKIANPESTPVDPLQLRFCS